MTNRNSFRKFWSDMHTVNHLWLTVSARTPFIHHENAYAWTTKRNHSKVAIFDDYSNSKLTWFFSNHQMATKIPWTLFCSTLLHVSEDGKRSLCDTNLLLTAWLSLIVTASSLCLAKFDDCERSGLIFWAIIPLIFNKKKTTKMLKTLANNWQKLLVSIAVRLEIGGSVLIRAYIASEKNTALLMRIRI